MKKILIFGNSGSGKSTLAKYLCNTTGVSHLDLDILAWQPQVPPARTPLADANTAIIEFINKHDSWVIEGCYADLLELLLPYSNEIIFMNLPVEACVANAMNRPWEPHKYESKEAQDKNLSMLIDWISKYSERNDELSESAHHRLYERYSGNKRMMTANGDFMTGAASDLL